LVATVYSESDKLRFHIQLDPFVEALPIDESQVGEHLANAKSTRRATKTPGTKNTVSDSAFSFSFAEANWVAFETFRLTIST
tara:strand:+ start:29731 stop:29976 length:246 start_codon:yes stop_codon:yes gene_type:complete